VWNAVVVVVCGLRQLRGVLLAVRSADGGKAMTVGDNGSNWFQYVASTSSLNGLCVVWQVYVDGKWSPYAESPVVPGPFIVQTKPRVCYKCGSIQAELYKEGADEGRFLVLRDEPGLCITCFSQFGYWKLSQHKIKSLPLPNKSRVEQKLLGTGDLKLV
jgi:hypothetical protein